MGISCYFSCSNFFFSFAVCLSMYGCVCVSVWVCVCVFLHVLLLGMWAVFCWVCCLRGWVDTGFSLILVSVFPLSLFFLSLVGVLSAYLRAKSYYIIYIWGGRFWVPILGGNGGW